ncbi:hypothetical protein ACP70R_029138 [Stipagrostis hirtigluma subsp. patula]
MYSNAALLVEPLEDSAAAFLDKILNRSRSWVSELFAAEP